MSNPTCGSLFASLCRLQLLETTQIRELTGTAALKSGDARDLARELLDRGWVTAFQMNQVLQGRAQELILGPYVLLDRLGEGGVGRVYKARHRALGRTVALKVLRKEILANHNVIRRFEREVQAAARLTHPNVVRAFNAGQAQGTYFLEMEYIEGVDLAKLVKEQGPLSVRRACDFIRQAALGLQHAHELGLIHRDIKPANLLVTKPGVRSEGSSAAMVRPPKSAVPARPTDDDYPYGIVKILDFGLARLQESDPLQQQIVLTQFGTVMGTPDFLAPEQAWDTQTVDTRADLYSLGCTFYYLLAGRVPFPKGTLPEKLMQHRDIEPHSVGAARRTALLGDKAKVSREAVKAVQVPAAVAAIVHRLLAKKPDDRFQTPHEVVDALAMLEILRPPAPPPPAASTGQAQPLRSSSQPRPAVSVSATVELARSTPQSADQALPELRRSRVRNLLVGAGLLMCCGLSLILRLLAR
jgi:serine/threonine-protein kinase